MAKFSRTSTAYKQDGSVVNANVPRFESMGDGTLGAKVEEGTVNLLPSNYQNVVVNGTPTSSAYEKTSGLVQGGAYTLSGKKRIFSDDNVINTRYSILFYYSDSTSDIKNGTYNAIPKDGTFYPFAFTATANSAKTLTKILFRSTDYGSGTFMHQECQNLIAEQKPYATSFHPTARAGESLTIPATALNASEGTIEFDFMDTTDVTQIDAGYPRLFYINQASVPSMFAYKRNGQVRVQYFDSDSVSYATSLSTATGKNIKTHLAVKYSLTSGKASLWINYGRIGSEITFKGFNSISEALSIGCRFAGNYCANALFSNLRISNKARTDAELANTGALAVDEWTTYFLPLNGTLSATCHPVILVQGQGQVLLKRTGRGTRTIKVQGSGQVKLKRSAQYYPTIAVGTKGAVQLSRQGIGYRSMKVEGQGSFKIVEPNIEIYPEIREREATTTIVERQSTTEVIGVPYAGDTIKIKGTFKSFEGVTADPTGITLKIYDTINNLLTTINVTATNKISAGVYEVNYTVPEGYQALYYEWHCVQGDSPQVTMGKITILKRGQAV